ncbi:MAG: zinc-dependent metalloprotease [Bacteroidetes bacterium]|nr:zinc-dependent metalloprotease [Bacteroidota bacterium]
MPGATSKTKIILDKIEFFDADNYLIVGKVDKTPLTAIFSSHKGRTGGLIQGSESTYEIYDLEEEGQLLVESNNADVERGFCGVEDKKGIPPLLPQEPAGNGRKSAANARIDPCTSNIRVLFLYGSGISSSTAFSFATNTIDALNTSISQSNVNNSSAYAEVAGYTSIDFTKSESDIRLDAVKLSNNSTAISLRTQYKADLVILITNDTWGNAIGGVTNPADVPHPNNGRAYGIVSLPAGGNAIVGAHELSHLYGCNHEDVAYGLYYSRAIVWGSGPTYASLVASGNSPGTRLLKYSNPTITGSGYIPEKKQYSGNE